MRRLAFAIALLSSTVCSAQPQAAQTNTSDGMGGVQPVTSLPENAPPAQFRNVPATTGRANLPQTPPPFAIETIGQVDAPFAMAFLPDGRLLVTEKAGKVKLVDVYRPGTGKPEVGISDVPGAPTVAQGGQGGLLDISIAPDFAASKTIYLTYAEPAPGGSVLALAKATLEFEHRVCVRAPCFDGAAIKQPRVIWRSGSPGVGGQFGSIVTFAPDGKSLYLTSGERQRFTPAQDPKQALGKILHLTLDGKAFPGNPMYAKGGVEAQTWTTGHRNPYGLVFAKDGRLWEVEMGPKGGDELNLIQPGRNYGWPLVSNGDNYSGQPIPDHPSAPQFQPPVLWWNPSISPGGMMLYSGSMFPQYRGSAFIAALSDKSLIRVTIDGATARPADQWGMGTRIRDVAQAPDGSIWLLEDGGRGAAGKLMRLTPKR